MSIKNQVPRIVLVDDDELMLKSLYRHFNISMEGADILTFSSPKQFIESLDTLTSIDILVSDYLMPAINGVELINIVRRRYPQVLTVLLTGDTTGKVLCKSSISATFIVAKPFRREEFDDVITAFYRLCELPLSESIKQALNETFIQNELPILLSRIEDIDLDFHKLEAMLEQEVLIQAKLFHLCNSAYVGLSTKQYSLSTAIKTLGVDLVSAIIVSACYHNMVAARYNIVNCEQLSDINFRKVKLLKELVQKRRDSSVDTERIVFIQSLLFLGELGSEIVQLITENQCHSPGGCYTEKLHMALYTATLIGYESAITDELYALIEALETGTSDSNTTTLLLLTDTITNKEVNQGVIDMFCDQKGLDWLELFYELRSKYFS
ncbi:MULTISPECIES: response regulator [Pseudoalteromonas]|uniref:response regulator n=1 Tax=Pseudoalteromonas TaxID=53246 RepID=UPI000FFE7D05|nr:MULTISPECIES: response regulator [Pseudoalteromonas]MCG9761586.1 response regulator [Pseudoalteromonas sp. Isolate6]NKC18680.1 response regulator [Pseudoalteromonas galatheae]RXE84812.1 response regulator [Pseudoalteromonas sp. A757]